MSDGDDLERRALERHRELRGKLAGAPKVELTPETLNLLYTPGVGAVAERLAEEPAEARELTGRANLVAVVSDGSAVLGLGDAGPEAALPVLEGKALLFKELAGIDAVPLALATQDPDAIVATITALEPSFGAVNLEDIASPRCYEVEDRLRAALDIPVVHDDQHATAIVTLAGLLNAMQVVGKELDRCKAVVVGGGAAGNAIARLLDAHGVGELVVTDKDGILSADRDDLDEHKRALAELTGRERGGGVEEALRDADVVIGVAVAGALSEDHVRAMADRPVVFALANPDPEIPPDEAQEAGAAVVATGRSDLPNQINNVLAFPGLFRGALDARASEITDPMKVEAARALAAIVEEPSAGEILPSLFDERVVPAVATAVREAAGQEA